MCVREKETKETKIQRKKEGKQDRKGEKNEIRNYKIKISLFLSLSLNTQGLLTTTKAKGKKRPSQLLLKPHFQKLLPCQHPLKPISVDLFIYLNKKKFYMVENISFS